MDNNKSVVIFNLESKGSDITAAHDIEWKIHDVTKEHLTDGKKLKSDVFELLFDDQLLKWNFVAKVEDSKLGFYLNMHEPKNAGFISKCEIFILGLNNEKKGDFHYVNDYSNTEGSGWSWMSFVAISKIFENFDKYLKDGTLTIGAKVQLIKSSLLKPITETPAFKDYFNKKISMDVNIICSDSDEVWAHRFVLVAASNEFEEISYDDSTQIYTLEVDDIGTDLMAEIVRYIYTGQVNNIDDYASKLLFGADKFELNGLIQLCVISMIKNLSVENAVEYFLLANQYKIKVLSDYCIRFFKMHHKALIKDASWEKLDKKHLNVILGYYQQNSGDILTLESSFEATNIIDIQT